MGLFLQEITEISEPQRPRISALAVWSIVLAVTGFLNVIGFPLGIVLGVVALMRLRVARDRGDDLLRGRRLAIAAISLSTIALLVAAAAFFVVLTVAYARLPDPPALHLF